MKLLKSMSLIICCASSASVALAAEPVDSVSIRSVKYAGTACPSGSLGMSAASWNAAKQALQVPLPSMIAEWGPGLSLSQSRSNCILAIDLVVPNGWQYALAAFEYSGYAKLDDGLKGELTLSTWFENLPTGPRLSQIFEGPYESDINQRLSIDLAQRQWSSCGQSSPLTLNTALKIKKTRPEVASSAQGFFSLESEFSSSSWSLEFRRCEVPQS